MKVPSIPTKASHIQRFGDPEVKPLPVETVSQCHPEAIAEGSRLRKEQKTRDSSLTLRMTLLRVSRLRHSLVGERGVRVLDANQIHRHLNPLPEGEEVEFSDKGRRQLAALLLLIFSSVAVTLVTLPINAAEKIEKLRVAYPAVAPGSTPSWITAEKKIWLKYGYDVETILVSGGARAVPALVSQSVQFLVGSDTGVTTAQLQGIPVVRLGVTMNTLGSSLLTQPAIQSVQDLKGKILGISRGRDASYVRLAKLLRDNGLNPNEDVKFLSIGGGEGGRLSAVKAGVIHGTMLFPPLDLIGRNEGLKVLAKFDVPTPGGGINTTAALLKQNRKLVINFLKGYIEGIHFMINQKDESMKILQRYFQNSDAPAMSYLYDETTRRLEKDLRANPESIRFHLDMAALDDPRAKQFTEKDFWDPSVVEEIRRSGFIDQLYKK